MLSLRKTTKTHSGLIENRTGRDRRQSAMETRFPFIDDDNRLIMKDRRSGPRRVEDDTIVNKSLKIFSNIIKNKS